MGKYDDSIISDILSRIDNLVLLVSESQSNFNRNNSDFTAIKKDLSEFINKVDGVPFRNEKQIDLLAEKIQKLLLDVERLNTCNIDTQGALEKISELLYEVRQFKEEYDSEKRSKFKSIQSRNDKVWQILKPLVIMLLTILISYLLIALGEALSKAGLLLQNFKF